MNKDTAPSLPPGDLHITKTTCKICNVVSDAPRMPFASSLIADEAGTFGSTVPSAQPRQHNLLLHSPHHLILITVNEHLLIYEVK